MTGEFHIRNGILETYTGREELVRVPEGVHTVGEGAFKACVSMKKVLLPPGLRRIMSGAFKGCRKLEEAEIPAGVCLIGAYAFHRCHSLKKIILPVSVEELGDCVFLYCDSLKEARIPGVRRLGSQVFVNDVLLERLEISEELEEECICDVFTGCSALKEVSFADGGSCRFPNAVEVVAGKMSVPNLVRCIAVDILRMMELEGRCLVTFRTNLKHVEIPEGIEQIGKSCFFDKRGILSVKLPASLRDIKSRAFRNCINLETVIFGGEKAAIHEDAFLNCSSLKSVCTSDGCRYEIEGLGGSDGEEIPETVRTIRRQVLENFRISGTILLKYLGAESRVWVPKGITVIAGEAFAGNEAVDRVILPESLQEIGAEAFRGCLLLQSVSVPEGVRRIGAGAFENCVKLLRLRLPRGVSSVEARTFRKCRALKEIDFGGEIRKIGEQAFYGCTALSRVQFPDSLTTVGAMAFYRCRALKEVRLMPRTGHVGSLAFAQSGVRKAWISGDGRNYGKGVFSGCAGLQFLAAQEGVCHIADKMAYGCSALSRVSLPHSLKSVGRNVWEGTPFLANWLKQEQKRKVFRDGRVLCGEKLRNAENLKAENCRFEENPEEEIFWDGRDLEGEVWLSETVRIVAGGAFYGNKNMTEIHLPEGVEWIGPAAFKGCSKLRRVWWPARVKQLEAEVFSGCLQLETVGISGCPVTETELFSDCLRPEADGAGQKTEAEPGGGPEVISQDADTPEQKAEPEEVKWKSVGERAFYQCRSLRRICPEQVVEIGKEAFFGCVSLRPEEICFGENGLSGAKTECFGKNGLSGAETECFGENGLSGAETECFGENGLSDAETAGIGKTGLWIGERAFENTAFVADSGDGPAVIGSIVVSGGNCSGEIRLREGIRGIAPFAFAGNSKITKVVLPESLDRIGEGAFWGCSGLAEVRFPETACRVNARAFEKCISLREADLRGTQIGAAAFACCRCLERVNIRGISVLAERLFQGCGNLEECICENAGAVQKNCFSECRRLKVFDFSHIHVVREYAFRGCECLEKAAFPEEACLKAHAFEDCSGLEEIILLGEQGHIRLWEYAFSGCTAMKWVTLRGQRWELCTYRDILSEKIPEMARLIFHSALSCFSVEKEEIVSGYRGGGRKIKIPKGIRKIEAEVFRDMLMLEEIEIPESVEYIGARAFHGTGWMEKCRKISPYVTVNHMLLDGSGCIGEAVVPEDIRLVCGWAFANGTEIRRISFLSEKVRVEAYAFRNCIRLEEIGLPDGTLIRIKGIEDREKELPALAKQAVLDSMNCFKTDAEGVLMECTGNISRLRVADGITAIGEGAFQDGNLLTEIRFPPTVEVIGKRAFAGCKWLREVLQAGSVREIGTMAFSGCGALEKVELSEHFRQMGARAFENCTSLREILVPEGVEEIPEKAFYRCHSLRKISLPSSLKRIGREAFAFCRELSEIRLPEGVLVEERAFEGCAAGKGSR